MKNPLIPIFLILCASFLQAQEQGTVLFKILPPIGKSFVKIGDSILHKSNKIILATGVYEVVIWSQYFDPKTIQVTVSPDSVIVINERLEISSNMLRYRDEKKIYDKKAIINRGIPIWSTGLLTLASTHFYLRAKRFEEDAFEASILYGSQRTNMGTESAKINFYRMRDRAKKAERTFYIFSGLTLATGALAIWGHRKVKKIKKPVYESQKPPFEINSLSLGLDQFSSPQLMAKITF